MDKSMDPMSMWQFPFYWYQPLNRPNQSRYNKMSLQDSHFLNEFLKFGLWNISKTV